MTDTTKLDTSELRGMGLHRSADEIDALRAEVAAIKAAVHEAEATVCDGRHATTADCVKAMAAERNRLADVALRLGGELERLRRRDDEAAGLLTEAAALDERGFDDLGERIRAFLAGRAK